MTDIALVTTTIHVPHLLHQIREHGPEVEVFIAGDFKSPDVEILEICAEIGNAHYYDPPTQERIAAEQSYLTHEIIGWNTISRRNFATLEAVRAGADILYFWDNDNVVFEPHFDTIEGFLTEPLNRQMLSHESGWVNPGRYASPPYTQRGFPYREKLKRQGAGLAALDFGGQVRGGKAGILSGLISGSPDVNATERIENDPYVFEYSLDAQGIGFAVDPKRSWIPLNSQNTAYLRELAPLMLLPPGLKRYDDIFGGYIAQRVLEATDYLVHFGEPVARQDRNEHDLIKDLEDEIWGISHCDEFCNMLRMVPVDPNRSILDNLERVCIHLAHWFDYKEMHQTARFLRAWPEDIEKVL